MYTSGDSQVKNITDVSAPAKYSCAKDWRGEKTQHIGEGESPFNSRESPMHSSSYVLFGQKQTLTTRPIPLPTLPPRRDVKAPTPAIHIPNPPPEKTKDPRPASPNTILERGLFQLLWGRGRVYEGGARRGSGYVREEQGSWLVSGCIRSGHSQLMTLGIPNSALTAQRVEFFHGTSALPVFSCTLLGTARWL